MSRRRNGGMTNGHTFADIDDEPKFVELDEDGEEEGRGETELGQFTLGCLGV